MEDAEIDQQYERVLSLLNERKAGMMEQFLQRKFGSRFEKDALLPEAVR